MAPDDKLIALNDDVATALLPVIIIIAMLMVIGLIGNPLVIYFFVRQMKTTPSHMFIIALAIFDMLSCSISMPFEIYELLHFYMFESPGACRTFRFVNHFASIASAATLIAIAVDRYRNICRPFNRQISVKLAKIIIGIVVMFSGFFSWPSLAFYTVVRVNLGEDPDLVGFDCTTRRDEQFKIYITIYNMILFLIFMVSIIVLIVIYCLVGKQLFQLKKFRFHATNREYSKSPTKSRQSEAMTMSMSIPSPNKKEFDKGENRSGNSEESSNPMVLSAVNLESTKHKTTELNGNHEFTDISRIQSNDSEIKREEAKVKFDLSSLHSSGRNGNWRTESTSPTTPKQPGDKKLKVQNINTKRYTIITLSISIAFVLSFLPYLSLVTWRTLAKDYEPNLLSEPAMVAFQLFLRSFLISSACNPIIYGFLNSEFKEMVVKAIRRVCCFCFMQKDSYEISRL